MPNPNLHTKKDYERLQVKFNTAENLEVILRINQ